jgi:formylglycine-generating enzyme required for sulfatase activity
MKTRAAWLILAGVMLASPAWAQAPVIVKTDREVLLGPQSKEEAPAWLAAMRHWREERLGRMRYSGAEYDRPELKWTQRSFIQPQMMVEDRYLYDPVAGKYTVDRYVDDVEKRYGGIDSVLVWAVYCNIGIDWRNQHDMVRALPGGLPGVRQMVADFHRRGVKVLFPVMPWDVGTRDEGAPLWKAIARTLKEVGADGVNGDTIRGMPKEYREASDENGHILAFEPENGLNGEAELPWNNMTWGYWAYNAIPTVSHYKWLEPRHMVNVCNRWARDHTEDLQHAFFNGTGFESWENVWGIWNGLTPRDAEAVRRIATIERACAAMLTSPGWEPHYHTLQKGVFASKFPGTRQTLWTLVNRTEYDIPGSQLRVPHETGRRYFDVWHGVELAPAFTTNQGVPSINLSFEIEGHGYGAVLALDPGAPDTDLKPLLARMNRLSHTPLHAFSREWKCLPQTQVPIKPAKAGKNLPGDMVRIPGGVFEFVVSGIMVEGGDGIGVDVQYPWEDSPRRHHRQRLDLKPFWIDRYPVTNARFKQFLDATGYRPRDGGNFLKDWKEGTFPAGWGNKPVTWVSLEDARAYARWAGKRLPHEWEWQYAAQGPDRRLFPWGNEANPAAVPPPDKSRNPRPPTDVDAFPAGGSPFGVMDLTGNVWQWTDEYLDEHTRAAVVRGGSYYFPQGSGWYFPNSPRLAEHGKLLLMAPSKDRAATLGFRCAMDAE